MKKLASIVLLTVFAVPASPLSQRDRNRALSELHATRKMFLDAVANLSEAQWRWKPAPDRWSIAECAEHVVLTETELFQKVVAEILKTPAHPERATEEQRAKDQQILKRMADRSSKAQAPESLRPSGKYWSPEELVEVFKKTRDRTISFVRDTQEDLHSHFAPMGSEELDAYQWILVIAGHTARHVEQIREIKNSPGFPAE